METENLGVLAGIIISLGFFIMIFAVVYLYKRERMAMIERGMDPRGYAAQPAPYKNLKWGLLLMGAGIGLFLAFIIHQTMFKNIDEDGAPAIYFALIAIFGGGGLVLSYRVEKKEILDKE